MRLPVVLLMGPTASGKSGLALALAERLPLEIVSVDSAQVYRGMDIGTAKPDAATRARAPHHLLDIVDPAEAYSAARFRADALRLIAEIRARGRMPLLVGGTMLYFRALQSGLSHLPAADASLRARIAAEAARAGWPSLHARLATVDPASAARLHPNDGQRIQRALELVELGGAPVARLQAAMADGTLEGPVVKLAVNPPDRALLHARIAQRFAEMIDAGLLDEVRQLRARGDLHGDLPSMRAVGYRQLWAHLEGECDLPTAKARGIAATRQLAKRQLTWLRAECAVTVLDPGAPGLLEAALERIEDGAVG
ncbi:MAG TPA: tRNA (adenosine(37)-N6)-dimethylallyltransferase MiaA [Verrucomicrobiae bacterium]|nr:tRNA (adenosine(37)-N6)-dimethylallyltransferase MiaA [Verrucomicrobiae bacterium]